MQHGRRPHNLGYNTAMFEPSILVTDDDDDFRETLKHVFLGMGFSVYTAADGVEALEVFERETIHIVTTDLHMPRLQGLAVLHVIHRAAPSVPCIIISGVVSEYSKRHAQYDRVVAIILKPARLQTVRAAASDAMWSAYQWKPN